eukprot:CCRYP_012426-RA/>CCRYP_012426-RA protein AED:0.09 eAED:0.09 QI:0/0.5/0.66/1/1/1/3/337/612
MPRGITSKKDKQSALERAKEQKSIYESFRSRAAVADTDLTSSGICASSNTAPPLFGESSDSFPASSSPVASVGSLVEDNSNDTADTLEERLEYPEDTRESLRKSLLPSSSTPHLTALQRLQTAVRTAAVTSELLGLLNDSVVETALLQEHVAPHANVKNGGGSTKFKAAVNALSLVRKKISIKTVHPRNAGDYTIIAFVNSASGGGKGEKLYKTLQDHLGESYVIDLKSCRPGNMPEDTLIQYAADPMVRILACGGDGTCGWIFSSLDKVWLKMLGECSPTSRIHLSKYKDHLPLAIMPLGTGNDLSRQFHWGGKFNHSMTKKTMIQYVQRGRMTKLDRWRCIIMPFRELGEEEKECIPSILSGNDAEPKEPFIDELLKFRDEVANPKKLRFQKTKSSKILDPTQNLSTQFFDGVFCNYLSLGFDATIAYLFHHERETHPEKFTSPMKNKLIYVQKSPAAMKAPKLKGRMKIMVAREDGSLMNLPIPKSCRAVVLMNIQSYGGGNHLANEGSPTDGLIEVIFVSNLIRTATSIVMGKVLRFMLFNVAAQTNRIVFRTMCPLHCQVDGEPWLQSEGIIQVKFHARNAILEKVTEDANNCDCMGGAGNTVIGAQ